MAKKSIQEDETKNRLKAEYFSDYDWTRVIGKIDLAVQSQPQFGSLPTSYLWAETKQGKKKDIYESFIQLILTIGHWRIYEDEMPPYFLGAADAEKIAFVDYSKVMHIFSKHDFNWNVPPSDHSTKEFKELYELLHDTLAADVRIFKFAYDDKQLRSFIKKNFREGRKDTKKQSVGKNNFTFVYFDWVKCVKDTIAVDWEVMQKAGVFDSDFFLADLMSKDGMSIKDKLKVILEKTKYKVLVKVSMGGFFDDAYQEFQFKDGQKAYKQFWNRYERPPKPIYQHHILERKDLLVPQDIREIEGSFYTPEKWVRLSQEYLAKALGEDWQEEYYVWDCAAGSGNLLRGLQNKYNVYASTLNDSDVKVMHDAIAGGRLNLVKSNVFQFDFLNDGYKTAPDGSTVSALTESPKIPESLRKILADPEKRKKLIIYINPPYKDLSTSSADSGNSKVHDRYITQLRVANRELFGQFLARILFEIPSCYVGIFSKLKLLQGPDFATFRSYFQPDIKQIFLMPANTFDNVVGSFPIAFQIYNLQAKKPFETFSADVYDRTGAFVGHKQIVSPDNQVYISKWITAFKKDSKNVIGWNEGATRNDFQSCRQLCILAAKSPNNSQPRGVWITDHNLMQVTVSYASRKIIQPTWINDRDQFLAPKPSWAGDLEFQTDCLIWTIFNNAVHEENGTCHWIPYYEDEVDAQAPFNSRFMADFLNGKIVRKPAQQGGDLFEQLAAEEAVKTKPLDALSDEAKAVLDAGREIWKYYMTKPGINVNASFLDIRAYFQGYKTTEKGKRMMNSTSDDAEYTKLLEHLRKSLKALEAHIEPKIYEHGFLLR